MHSDTYTIQPVTAGNVIASPEFSTVADTRKLFGIPRSSLYELEKLGLVRLLRLRKPGNKLGKVLVDCASVRKYLAHCATNGGSAE